MERRGRWAVVVSGVACLTAVVPARAATVQEIGGKVTVTEAGTGSALNSAALPRELAAGAKVETGADGRARVVLDDRSEVTLGPGSEFALPAAGAARELGVGSLLMGKVRALVRSAAGTQPAWRVRARDAVMGVRGTEFILDVNRDRTLLCAFAGVVDVEVAGRADARTVVQSNEGVVIDSDGRVSQPVAMDRGQMDWWRQETLVGAAGSESTRLRTLGADWHWGGPVAAERLDPGAMYSQYQLLFPEAWIWGRAVRANGLQELGNATAYSDTNLTARAALGAALVPTVNYLLYAQGTAAAKAGLANPDAVGIRLHQAFVLVRPKSSHSVVLGRQEWNFGDGLIIGKEPWNPRTRSFDGALVAIRTAPVKARAMFSVLADRKDLKDFDDYLAGFYSEFSKVPLDVYGFWIRRTGNAAAVSPQDIQSSHVIVGERGEFDLGGPFFANEEWAVQVGGIKIGSQERDLLAYVALLEAGITWNVGGADGLVKGVFLQASGDGGGTSGRFGSFLSSFNDSHRFFGIANAFPQLRNIQRLGASASIRHDKLGRPLTAQLDFSHFTRLHANDLFPRGTLTGSRVLGNEIDLTLGVEVLPQIFTRLAAGVLYPGAAYGDARASVYKAFLAVEAGL